MNRARTPLPLATFAIAAAVVAVYAVELGSADPTGFASAYGLTPSRRSFATAVSSLFVHDPSSAWHVGGNVLVLVLVGGRVERSIGSLRFASLFFAGGLFGAALHCFVDPTSTLVGCSASLFAVLAVAAVLFGAPMLAFVVVLLASNVLHAFGGPGPEGVSFAAHCGGAFVGALVVVLARLRGVELRHNVAA